MAACVEILQVKKQGRLVSIFFEITSVLFWLENQYIQKNWAEVFLTFRASVSSFRMVLVSLFPFSASVSRWGRAASVGRSRRNASSVSSVKPSSRLTTVAAWRCRCEHRRSMSRVVRGIPDRSNVPLDRGADSTAFRLQRRTWHLRQSSIHSFTLLVAQSTQINLQNYEHNHRALS